MAITGVDLAVALGVNGVICLVMMLIFCVMRVNPIARKYYAPKRFDPEIKKKPRRMPLGLVSWMVPTYFYPEDEVIAIAGMDVAVFLRLLAYGWVLFAFCTFWCLVAIMPVNATGGYLASDAGQAEIANQTAEANASGTNTTEEPLYSDLDTLSTSNIEPGSPRFWMHLVSVYVIGIFAMMLLYAWSMGISKMRAKFIATLPRGGVSHTVLVTDVPGVQVGTVMGHARKVTNLVPENMRNQVKGIAAKGMAGAAVTQGNMVSKSVKPEWMEEDRAALTPEQEEELLDPWAHASNSLANGTTLHDYVEAEMKDVYGASHVAAVNPAYDTGKLAPLVAKYEAAKQNLTDITSDYVGKIRRKQEIKQRKELTLRPMFADKWTKETFNVTKATKVDAMDYYSAQLEHLKQEIEAQAALSKELYEPAAFVTFNDRYTQTLCATGMHSYDEQVFRTEAAPGNDEIIWGSLRLRYWEKTVRNLAMWGVFIVVVIFYLPVTAAIQAVVNLDNIRNIPGLGEITRIPFVTQILKGVLPGLVLTIFLIILPPLLNLMNRFAGAGSISQMDLMTVSKFFIFQVFATFLFTFFTGTLLAQIADIIEDPSTIVQLLGVAAPQQATFFMSFILVNACGAGMALLKLVGLIIFLIRSKIAGTEKARYRLWARQEFLFGPYTAFHTITVLLGLSFCILSPLIAPFCLLYFTLSLLVQKYQMVYVLRKPYEANGRMWLTLFHQIMVGMYFMVAMLILVLMFKRFPFVWLAIPLGVFMVLFHHTTAKLFDRPWSLMSLKEAAILDRADGSGDVTAEEAEEIRKIYLHPGFKIDEAEHAQAINEAKSVDNALKTGSDHLDIQDMSMMEESTSHKEPAKDAAEVV